MSYLLRVWDELSSESVGELSSESVGELSPESGVSYLLRVWVSYLLIVGELSPESVGELSPDPGRRVDRLPIFVAVIYLSNWFLSVDYVICSN